MTSIWAQFATSNSEIGLFSQQAALLGLGSSPFGLNAALNGNLNSQFGNLNSASLTGVGGNQSLSNSLAAAQGLNNNFSNGLNLTQQSLDALALQGHQYAPGSWDVNMLSKKRKESFGVPGIVLFCNPYCFFGFLSACVVCLHPRV